MNLQARQLLLDAGMGLQHGGRGPAQTADAKRGGPAEDETGHDFIQAEPAELLPHQHDSDSS